MQPRCAREIARFNPDDVAGYDRFLKKSEQIYEVGFEELGHVPFGRVIDMARIAPAMVALESYRTVYGLVSKYIKDERLRQVFSLPPAPRRRQPVLDDEHLHAHRLPRAEVGRVVRDGRDGRARPWHRRPDRRPRRDVPPRRDGRGDHRRAGPGDGRAARQPASTSRPTSSSRTPTRRGPTATSSPPSTGRRGPTTRVDRAKLSMSLFVWYFGTDKQYDDVAHHTILLGPRYRELLDDIFHKKHLADDFSLYLHRPTATDPTMAPPGHDSVLRPLARPAPRQRDRLERRETERYRKAIEAVALRVRAAGARRPPHGQPHADAAGLPRRLPLGARARRSPSSPC